MKRAKERQDVTITDDEGAPLEAETTFKISKNINRVVTDAFQSTFGKQSGIYLDR